MAQHAHRATCKVVLRHDEVGARVYPRGCKVRYKLKPNGTVVKIKKSTGQEKPKKTTRVTTDEDFHVYLAYEGNQYAPFRRFLWDTGATHTSMSRRTAYEMGIIDRDAPGWNPVDELLEGLGGSLNIASGAQVPYRMIEDVPFEVSSEPNAPPRHDSEVVTGDVVVTENSDSLNLFGVSHMRNVKQTKVKFRQAGQGSSGGAAFAIIPPPGWS